MSQSHPSDPSPDADIVSQAALICQRVVTEAQQNVDEILRSVQPAEVKQDVPLAPASYALFSRRWSGLSDVLVDPRTGVASRILLWDRLRHALARQKRHGTLFGVLYVGTSDPDERHVPRVAARLVVGLRDTDTIAYAGNAEFVIVLEEIGSSADAMGVAQRIQQEMSGPSAAGEAGGSASIGVAVLETPGSSPEPILWEAYTAMRRAQKLGPGRIEICLSVE